MFWQLDTTSEDHTSSRSLQSEDTAGPPSDSDDSIEDQQVDKQPLLVSHRAFSSLGAGAKAMYNRNHGLLGLKQPGRAYTGGIPFSELVLIMTPRVKLSSIIHSHESAWVAEDPQLKVGGWVRLKLRVDDYSHIMYQMFVQSHHN